MGKGKKSRKKQKREAKLQRKRLTAKMVAVLTPRFGKWCSEHMPKGSSWDDAATGGMVESVGKWLATEFPSMDPETLDRIAESNVRVKERRINVDMPGLARAILRAGGAIN